MEIINIPIGEIVPYDKNPRDNKKAVDYVANSIKEFGFKVPIIVDKDNVIVAGHTRLLAAKKLHMEEVPCIMADDLSDEQIKAFRLADNKVSEFSAWEKDILAGELGDIININMDLFGFTDSDMDILKKEEEEEPELQFTEVLGEEHNYVVLYFDNSVDWLQMESILDLEGKMNLSTRKDGRIGKNMKRVSVGRVFNGAEALERMREHFENLH